MIAINPYPMVCKISASTSLDNENYVKIDTARFRQVSMLTCGVLVADSMSSTACVSASSSPCSEAPADEPSPSDQAPDDAPPLPRPFSSLRGERDGVLAPEFTSENNTVVGDGPLHNFTICEKSFRAGNGPTMPLVLQVSTSISFSDHFI